MTIKTETRKNQLQQLKNRAIFLFIVVCSIFCGYCEANAGTVKNEAVAASRKSTNKANKAGKAANKASTDKAIIKRYIRKRYGKSYRVVIRPAMKITDKELETRKEKHIVYVEYLETISDGRRGGTVTDKGIFHGSYTRYAKRRPKGEKVRVYHIFNPDSNYTDDIIAIVNNGAVRD